MNCEWCEQPVLDTMPYAEINGIVYHIDCIMEFKRLQDEQYDRIKEQEQKWDVND